MFENKGKGQFSQNLSEMKFYFALCIFLFISRESSSEFFTAVSHLEKLFETESLIIDSLEKYMNVMRNRVEGVKIYLEQLEKENEIANRNTKEYFHNPINSYLAMKRLTIDWEKAKENMMDDPGGAFVEKIKNSSNERFPTKEDLSGIMDGLLRLHHTYNLEPLEVARGELNGIKHDTELSAADCFDIGLHAYDRNDFYYTKSWMSAAYELYKEETPKTIEKSEILDYLAYSTYKQGDVREALELTNEILDSHPSDEKAQLNKIHYEEILERFKNGKKKGDDEDTIDTKRKYFRGRNLPHKLCNYELKMEESIMADLKCRYADLGNAFLKLARFKVEELYPDPRILLYHDVISDREIEILKKLAKPNLKRAQIYSNEKLRKMASSSYRISEIAWLRDQDHPIAATINKRIGDMTGLDMETAEFLQVNNYGIGGHYLPHFDCLKGRGFEDGNRIATVLIYLTDVEQGGATIFPTIRVAVKPKKGAAVFWYNVLPSGEPDVLTLHAACPVLAGSKWVCNKWIHEHGQEFRRPCGLKEYDV